MASADQSFVNSLAVPSIAVSDGAAEWGNLGAAAPENVLLDPEIYRDQFLCANCAGTKLHLEIFRFENGWLICCQGCGEERVVRKLPFAEVV
jgi:hypothetical protein